MKTRVLLLLLVLLLGPLGSAWSAIKLQIQNQTIEVTYNPDVGLELTGTIEVRHRQDPGDFFVTIGTGQSGSFGARSLSTGADSLTYQIYDNAVSRRVVKDLFAATGAGDVLWGVADTQTNRPVVRTVSYYLEIPAGQLLQSGIYTDSLVMTVYSGTVASPVEQDSATLSITGPVANSISVGLVDAGYTPTMGGPTPATTRAVDFGELTEGQQAAMDLLVEANCAFTIAVESANDGFLAHTDIANPSAIPYEFDFAGTVADFSSGGAVTIASSPGYRYPIVITVGAIGNAGAGNYEDSITIAVTAQ